VVEVVDVLKVQISHAALDPGRLDREPVDDV
jgi:hypothetical protein